MLVLDDKGKDEEGLAKDAIEKGALQEEPEPVITLDEYDIVGYGVVPLTGDDAKLRYGNYDVELFKAPVIVRDKDQLKKLPCKL